MPIQNHNKGRYSKHWKQISWFVRHIRARWQCEAPDCRAEQNQKHPITGSKVILTVAHLDHRPENNDLDNLMVLCQRCHLSLDCDLHSASRERNRKGKYIMGDGYIDHYKLFED